MGGHHDLHGPFLILRVLLDKVHHTCLQLGMQVSLGLFHQKHSKFVAFPEQNQFGCHKKRVVVAKTTRTALVG